MTHSTYLRSHLHGSRGMTLIEIVIGMVIFTGTILTILYALLTGNRTADRNLLNTTAFLYAQSYLEDIKGVPYAAQLLPPTKRKPALPADTPHRLLVRNGRADKVLIAGVARSETVDYRNTPANDRDDMVITLTPKITATPEVSANRTVDACDIQLTYTWRLKSESVDKARTAVLRVVHSGMPRM